MCLRAGHDRRMQYSQRKDTTKYQDNAGYPQQKDTATHFFMHSSGRRVELFFFVKKSHLDVHLKIMHKVFTFQ